METHSLSNDVFYDATSEEQVVRGGDSKTTAGDGKTNAAEQNEERKHHGNFSSHHASTKTNSDLVDGYATRDKAVDKNVLHLREKGSVDDSSRVDGENLSSWKDWTGIMNRDAVNATREAASIQSETEGISGVSGNSVGAMGHDVSTSECHDNKLKTQVNDLKESAETRADARDMDGTVSVVTASDRDETRTEGGRLIGHETELENTINHVCNSDGKGSAAPEIMETSEKNSASTSKEPLIVGESGVSDTIQEPGGSSSGSQGHERPVRYKCLKCSRVMKDKRLIENHSCDTEADEEKVKITITLNDDKKSFTCKECEYSNSGHSFEEHLMCHLMVRPYQCLYCKECFINRKEISRHVLKSHNGAKMSCALRALRKAKALIKEATTSGTVSFMAKVAGKVPLERDPDKKKKLDGGNNSIQNLTSPDQCDETNVQVSEDDKTEKTSKICSGQEVTENKQSKENQQSYQGFSKLREVLISGCSALMPKASQEEHTTNAPEPGETSDQTKSDSDSGLKIVASFSLQDMESQAPESEKAGSRDVVEPNFIMTPLPEKEKEPEVLSFLGPERPIFKTSDSSYASMLPPPPLQPAPFHSSNKASLSHTVGAMKQTGSSPNFFICGFNCLFSSLSSTDFHEHTVNYHSTETFYPCYYCGHRSPNETDLVRHISNHTLTHNKSSPLYVCGNAGCMFGTNMVPDYINHIKASHPDISEPLCYSCGDTFSDCKSLHAHVEDSVIHIVNCPHCPSKATDRKTILNHISSAHLGKPKMVSVAKQLICHDRKVNNFEQMAHLREVLPPTLTPAPVFATSTGSSVIDQILGRRDLTGDCAKSNGSSLSDMLTSGPSVNPRVTSAPLSTATSPDFTYKEATPDDGKSPASESSDFGSVRVKEEIDKDSDSCRESGNTEDSRGAYIIDENGVRRRIYVPMSERRAENYKCRHCTFIARDLKRMHCHERSHGMPPSRKERFRCMFCPQGFDSELKFRLHITCHPGLIKFLLYRCKKCEFDTNQKHTIVRHITCNRDRKHRGYGPVEDQYTVVSRSLESRVLECERCDYMTRHKIHMAIHYQRKHNILRDRGEFTIESITPTDTPITSRDLSPEDPHAPSPSYSSLQSPDSSHDDTFDFTKPSGSAKKSKEKLAIESSVLSVTQITERNELFNRMVSQQAALQQDHVQENQMRKFKCPICKYLLPKAADLKNHVKRHSEIGQITLVMFRCKYCSCMSTARELLYEHLAEKHPGKPIALVKKIVAIDTTDVDKSFAETSMEESLDQLEESLHKEIITSQNSASFSTIDGEDLRLTPYEQLFVIPEGGETFSVPLQCPKCPYSSHKRSEIIEHVTSLHSEVKVIGSDEDVDNLARATKEDIQQHAEVLIDVKPSKQFLANQEEVLIVPDDQIFKEPALCSRCDFTTMLRREMVIHLQQNHPEISVMGRNSYPVQVSAMGHQTGPLEESCVVGSGSLDAKIRCLYKNYGTQMKCLICGAERPKKFFIHVHILRHLNIYLWKCAFCAHRGLQKYKMVDHIKKIHSGKPLSVRYLRVNVEAKVTQFLTQLSTIKSNKPGLIDDGQDVPLPSLTDEFTDQSIIDSNAFRQKSPGAGSSVGCSSPQTLGSDELDEKISCLYDNNDGQFYRCIACSNQFQRKFAMHRHIIISHLKVSLLSCAYCGMEGVERHQIVDHILACHKPAPVSILPLDIDLHQKVSEFLTKMAAVELSGDSDTRDLSSSKSKFNKWAPVSCSKKLKFGSVKFGKSLKTPNFKFGKKGLNVSTGKKTNIVDPDVVMLGRHALDKQLRCLYQERPSGQLKCLVCKWEFPRKYPLHRHIMLKHLKMNLVGCPYCPFEGIEKYNVSTHIKEDHENKPVSIMFLQPNVEAKVRQFVEDMTNFGGKGQVLDRRRESGDSSLIRPKIERDDDDNDDDDDDDGDDWESDKQGDDDREGEIDNIDNEDERDADKASHGGLVVAMFGKKKKQDFSFDDVIVKSEIDDEDYEELNIRFTNDDDDDGGEEKEDEQEFNYNDEESGNDYNEDEDPGADKSNYDPSDDPGTFSLKYHGLDSYAPGSYRSPAGGKPKALDVTTKIKVLKSKEGPIMKFYCEKCNFTSLHRSNVVRHIYKIHEKYQTHTCPFCHYQTLSLMLMQKHMLKEHPGEDYKESSFTHNPRVKLQGKPIMGPLSFQKRQQQLLSKRLNVKNSASSSNSGPKQYACAYCHYETSTQEDILQHTRDNHSQDDDSSALKSQNTSGLVSTGLEESSSACWDGSKKAVKKRLHDEEDAGAYRRKRRFTFEKGNELIQCGHCDTKETSMSRMQDHLTWDHPGLPFQAKRIPAWRFMCKSCAVKTMATSKMKYHLNRHVNYRPYTCTNCGAFFPSPDQCRRHSRSQGHEEQYVYVRNPKKEARVAELLEGTRQLALKVQEEAAKDPDFDISHTDSFIARFQENRGNLRRSAPAGSTKSAKKMKSSTPSQEDEGDGGDEEEKKQQSGKSPQTVGLEQDITIKCYNCEFTSSNVSSVSIHHNQEHPEKKFLWTELERGFTCDSSGEALPDCDSVPSSSMDVGYTTRMTLGAGNNTMRFKCKTCDFSSCVIQAMKSHLKSHQPKGFMCPYCSRSFSGKEKLMRHQYCLHKGQELWVIHLRMSGVAGSTSVKKGKGVSTEDGVSDVKTEEETPTGRSIDKEMASTGKQMKKTSQTPTVFLCSECSYSSESLYHFRLHLAQEHEEFKYKIVDTSVDSPLKCGYCPFLAETETEFSSHIEAHLSTRNFQCGYCDYSAYDRSSVQRHLGSNHSSLEPKILALNTKENMRGQDRKDLPLLLNLKPHVTLEKMPDSVLHQYSHPKHEEEEDDDGCSSEQGEDIDEDEEKQSCETAEIGAVNKPDSIEYTGDNDADDDDDDDEERLMVVETASKLELNKRAGSGDRRNSVDRQAESTADSTDADSFRELGLAENESSCVPESETDMMVMELGEIDGDNGNSSQGEDGVKESQERRQEQSFQPKSTIIPNSGSLMRGKDSTLFAAQDSNDKDDSGEDDEDDDDDVVTFDNDITLASPLPLISLGDGVVMSPITMDNADDGDGDDDRVMAAENRRKSSVDSDSEMLLDI